MPGPVSAIPSVDRACLCSHERDGAMSSMKLRAVVVVFMSIGILSACAGADYEEHSVVEGVERESSMDAVDNQSFDDSMMVNDTLIVANADGTRTVKHRTVTVAERRAEEELLDRITEIIRKGGSPTMSLYPPIYCEAGDLRIWDKPDYAASANRICLRGTGAMDLADWPRSDCAGSRYWYDYEYTSGACSPSFIKYSHIRSIKPGATYGALHTSVVHMTCNRCLTWSAYVDQPSVSATTCRYMSRGVAPFVC